MGNALNGIAVVNKAVTRALPQVVSKVVTRALPQVVSKAGLLVIKVMIKED